MMNIMFISRRMRMRWARDTKAKLAWSLFIFVFLIVFIDSFGFVKVYFEKDFETEFSYPLDVYDFPSLVHRFRNGEKVEYQPTNTNYSGIKFHETASQNCKNKRPLGLVILVKSAPSYFDKRAAIRATWGNAQYLLNISNTISSSSPLVSCVENQFDKSPNLSHNHKSSADSSSIFPIKLVFLIGTEVEGRSSRRFTTELATALEDPLENDKLNDAGDDNINKIPISKKDKISQNQRSNSNSRSRRLRSSFTKNNNMQRNGDGGVEASLDKEILKYNDIIRADFIDSYENNTYKTMAGLRWAVEVCPDFQYAFLVDDDMYISVKNLIKFMEAPTNYPSSVSSGSGSEKCDEDNTKNTGGARNHDKIYAGKVIVTRPVRYIVSKWYLSLEEYPFNYFPPYMPAAAILMSKSVVEDFYYASLYTQHFRFDDIFLAILAYKMKIPPLNSNYFHVCHTADGKCPDSGIERDSSSSSSNSNSFNNYEDPMEFVIARHGLSGPKELIQLWNEQKSNGKLN